MQVCKGAEEVKLRFQWAVPSLNLVWACGVNCSKQANISDWSNQYSTSALTPPLALEICTRWTWKKKKTGADVLSL